MVGAALSHQQHYRRISHRLRSAASRATSFAGGCLADPSLRYSLLIEGKETTFTGLPFAGLEVENLTSILSNPTSFIDGDFSLSAIKGRIEDHNICHFVTHATFLPSIPEQSFILFSKAIAPTS